MSLTTLKTLGNLDDDILFLFGVHFRFFVVSLQVKVHISKFLGLT